MSQYVNTLPVAQHCLKKLSLGDHRLTLLFHLQNTTAPEYEVQLLTANVKTLMGTRKPVADDTTVELLQDDVALFQGTGNQVAT